jgi:alpha-ribazole phosphatase
MKLVLVRHPPPDIAAGVCYGRRDIPVRADVAAMVREIAAEVVARRVARVWTSPAIRCRAVADATGLPLRIDPRLLELDFGAWEGMAWDDVPRASLDAWAADPLGFAPPAGESGAAVLARVAGVHRDLIRAGEDAAIVSHGGPLKLLAALLRGEPPDLLARAPPLGSMQVFAAQASSDSTAHSVATEAAPNTSPV